ncbi:hypothetical protein [Paenibacillus ferrarius]|uniref:hypothetical protein n=1 Tax=Paenibacillus ferrarius TaxID=1469647 RepID=UPI003D2C0BA6
MLSYTYNASLLTIQESPNGDDIEFRIHVLGGDAVDRQVMAVQHDFEHNHVLTDVLFYAFKNHDYQFIVRKDFYDDFLLSLLKHRLLTSLAWT